MIDWNQIETVMFDMDGTLLDLHFDNHFWQTYVPQQYASKHALDPTEANAMVNEWFMQHYGTLKFYCLDFWSEQLQLDIALLKEDLAHLIQLRPFSLELLQWLKASDKRSLLVTNAHRDALDLKMKRTEIADYFDAIYCSHDFATEKEQPAFWDALREKEHFDPASTALFEDNTLVLRSARDYGIGHLFYIAKPDSKRAAKRSDEFETIDCFSDIIPAGVTNG